MRLCRLRLVPAGLVVAATMALGAAATAHLPKAVVVQAGSKSLKAWTYRTTVGEVLEESGIRLRAKDRVTPSLDTRLETGLRIVVRRSFGVTLVADGKKRAMTTASATVEELLGEAGIRLRPRDRVYPVMDAVLRPGAAVRVVRIETRIVSREERVPYARLSRPDATLPRGMTRVAQQGRPGVRLRRVAVTMADGAVIERQLLSEALLQPPQDRIMQVGTRRMFATRGEFAGKEIVHMEATAYAPWHGRGVDGTTAIGLRAGYGVVAVDPRVIPLRSRLFIEGYGRAVAGDTGGAIKGHRIDLGFNTAKEAYRFGRRPVRVYILSSPQARSK